MRKLKYTKEGAEDISFREPGQRWRKMKYRLQYAGRCVAGWTLYPLVMVFLFFQGIVIGLCVTAWIWIPTLICMYFLKG